MAAQRPRHLPPAVLGYAEHLPIADKAADAVMAILTLHHWSDVEAGLREAVRVARRRLVIFTVDPVVEAEMWLFAEYLPDVAERDGAEFPSLPDLLGWLGPSAESRNVTVPRDCTDGFLLSFWGNPEGLLDADARRATSGFARLTREREAEAVEQLSQDLDSGSWDERHGELRRIETFDAGLRLVVAQLR